MDTWTDRQTNTVATSVTPCVYSCALVTCNKDAERKINCLKRKHDKSKQHVCKRCTAYRNVTHKPLNSMPKYKLIQSMKQNFAVIMNTLSDS